MTYTEDMTYFLDVIVDIRERDSKPSKVELSKDEIGEADRKWQLLARKE